MAQLLYIWAAWHGCSDAVAVLLRAGANKEAHRYQKTPLFAAAEQGHTQVVSPLLQARANPRARFQGMTPVAIARQARLC